MKWTYVVIALIFAAPCIQAQDGVPTAVLDTTMIRIGEQTRLHLSITYRADQGERTMITWPEVGDTITEHIEVVKRGDIDTLLLDPDQDPFHFAQQRVLIITAWDSGYWAIPPFRFVVNGDTTETLPLLLEVRTVAVDTAEAIRDIKEIHELPFSWGYWFRQNWPYVAGGVAVLAALVLLIRQVRKRKKEPLVTKVVEPQLSLQERTLKALEEVRTQRLWQHGEVKAHFSVVTDILRGYLEERYQVHALERTTDELMGELTTSSLSPERKAQLGNILRLADMVKFAKLHPGPSENEQLVEQAIRFVLETSPLPAHETQA